MTIREIYNLAIKLGIENDFRSKEVIEKQLLRLREKYEKMDADKKSEFDAERLENPYSDTRILFGDPDRQVKKILVGIDMEGDELLLAEKMGDIDLVASHHPRGKALVGLDDVMQLQVDVLEYYGVPVNVAEKLLKKRIDEVSRGISPANHYRSVDMARHLGVPYMSIHTPCDNMVAQFVKNKVEKDNPQTVGDLLVSLKEVYEYKESMLLGAGPKIFVGSEDSKVGKIVFTEITGGTEGSPEIYERLVQAGAGTVVGMHIDEKHREEAEKAHINVVIAGHISSDSIGMNLFYDHLEKQGVEIIPCSGFIRHSRN